MLDFALVKVENKNDVRVEKISVIILVVLIAIGLVLFILALMYILTNINSHKRWSGKHQ